MNQPTQTRITRRPTPDYVHVYLDGFEVARYLTDALADQGAAKLIKATSVQASVLAGLRAFGLTRLEHLLDSVESHTPYTADEISDAVVHLIGSAELETSAHEPPLVWLPVELRLSAHRLFEQLAEQAASRAPNGLPSFGGKIGSPHTPTGHLKTQADLASLKAAGLVRVLVTNGEWQQRDFRCSLEFTAKGRCVAARQGIFIEPTQGPAESVAHDLKTVKP